MSVFLKKIGLLVLVAVSIIACQQKEIKKPIENKSSSEITTSLKLNTSNTKMVYISGGEYKPFYGSNTDLVKVKPFFLDEHPVTNQEFLDFVKANPQWQRSNVKKIYADSNYLKLWIDDTTLPKGAKLDAPICSVSWFAAKAYAKSIGKRLPTLDEWEFAAMADEEVPNAREKKTYSDHIVDLYLVKDKQLNAVKQSKPNYWGVYNMFDLVWEWTDDFNSVLTTGDSRAGVYDDKGLFCAGSATAATDVLNYAAFMRFSLRQAISANFTIANLGFRCAKDSASVKN